MPRYGRIKKIKWISLPRNEKALAMSNPYCGLYSIFRFYADCELIQPDNVLIENTAVSPDQQLCLIEINLIHYNESLLSEDALYIIRRIFLHFTELGKQMIVRFLYDWDGKGVLHEPKDLIIILNHMKQLSPLLKEYTKSIYILQGLFIGSWGEMHNSRYLGERQMVLLTRQLYECSGDYTQIALRCPSFWRMIFKSVQPLEEESAFSNIRKARFSLFNDGIMASETDYGTYGSISAKDTRSCSEKWARGEELEFQGRLCRYVSNGGEVINDNPYNNVPLAIETLKEMRISYLHWKYDEQVLNKWKASRSGVTNVLWRDKTAYEYIIAHLGYRFTIEEVSLSNAAGKDGMLKADLMIRNLGFAPCYHRFCVTFVVRTTSFLESYEYSVDTDTRKWMPEEKVAIEIYIPAEDLKPGNYNLCFGIYDQQSQTPIQIANTFSSMDYTGRYNLGNFITYS
ncbi:MAG: hypothetical protein K0R46_576 [Herbinix sp.]|nr:hypothetical protein [Herbinix sp.]